MRTINKKRAELLTPILGKPMNEQEEEDRVMTKVNCQFTVNALAYKLLIGTFSYKEDMRCDICESPTESREVPIVTTHQSLLPDFSNFTDAMLASFIHPTCPMCTENLTIVEREFGQCLYIEVHDLYFIF